MPSKAFAGLHGLTLKAFERATFFFWGGGWGGIKDSHAGLAIEASNYVQVELGLEVACCEPPREEV